MNKYQVYLTTNETIYIEADEFQTYCEYNYVRFLKDKQCVAVFILSNICGFEQVNAFDDEENDE